MERSKNIFYSVIMFSLIFCLGWTGNNYYSSYTNDRALDGFYLSYGNMSIVEEYQDIKDPYGDWVCVNVKNMEYPSAYDVCVHECSHKAYTEIFAESCEEDFESCRRLLENE